MPDIAYIPKHPSAGFDSICGKNGGAMECFDLGAMFASKEVRTCASIVSKAATGRV
jgi:hypothetical protein